MKSKILSLAFVFFLIFSLSSCFFLKLGQECEITVITDDSDSAVITLPYGSLLPIPEEPKREGYIFRGWYSDSGYKTAFDFQTPIVSDTAIYALWELDTVEYINNLSSKALSANVFIAVYNSDIFGNPITSAGYTSGSGAVYKEDAYNYYILTNNHVVSKNNSVMIVTDAFGNEYSATVIAKDISYDLAVLKIRKSGKTLQLAELAAENPVLDLTVASVGNPNSQKNTVTLGVAARYEAVEVKEEDKAVTNVTFEVLWHTCPTDHGSSGGALYDNELKLAGINYGGIKVKNGTDYNYALAIPIEKVKEFLIANNLMP